MSIIDELAEVIEYETCNRAMAERIAKAVVDLLASKAGDVRGMLPDAFDLGVVAHATASVAGETFQSLCTRKGEAVLDLCAKRIAPIVGALRGEGQTFRIRACMPEPDEPVEHVAVTKNGVTTLLREVEAPVPVAPFDPKDYCGVKVPDSDEPVADPAERAKAVARILRGRGIAARTAGELSQIWITQHDVTDIYPFEYSERRPLSAEHWQHMGPGAIADAIPTWSSPLQRPRQSNFSPRGARTGMAIERSSAVISTVWPRTWVASRTRTRSSGSRARFMNDCGRHWR